MHNRYKTWKYWRDEWVYPFVVAIFLATLIRIFIIQPFKIPSTSMDPTLQVGDRIFVSKFLYGAKIPFTNKRTPKIRDPIRGDIVVFVSVTDPDYPEPRNEYLRIFGPVFFNKDHNRLRWYTPRFLVKRLVGLPGDRVEINKGKIYINGALWEKPLLIRNRDYFNEGDYGREDQVITVPEYSYFVLGDNSGNSIDSRYWGFVPKGHLTGKAFIVWWPVTRIHLLK